MFEGYNFMRVKNSWELKFYESKKFLRVKFSLGFKIFWGSSNPGYLILKRECFFLDYFWSVAFTRIIIYLTY